MTEDGPAPRTVVDERSLSPMRKTIADRLQKSSQEAVHVTVSREADAEALLAAASDAEPIEGPAGERVEPSVMDVLLCALSDTLSAHPSFNGTFADGTHRIYEEHNVGVAVDIDAGLVTPVIADLEGKSVGEIAAERRRLTDLVKAGEFSMSTFKGGTFTVSNLGPLGVDTFTPVINPPEIAILGVGRIRDAVVPDGEGTATRRRLTLDVSFDHRVVDGADAARFLTALVEHVESVVE